MAGARRRLIQCPTCQTSVALPDNAKAGSTIRCPRCGQRSQLQAVPPLEDSTPAPPPPSKPRRQARGPAAAPVAVAPVYVAPPPPAQRSGSPFKALLAIVMSMLIIGGSVTTAYFMLRKPGAEVIRPDDGDGDEGEGDKTTVGPAPSPEAAQVQAILKANCHRCHGDGGSNEGGFNFVLRREKLVEAGGYVVAGKPDESLLLQRIKSGQMPPDAGTQLAASDIAVIQKWIESGAPEFSAVEKREFIPNDKIFEYIKSDLIGGTLERDRRFVRYFTLTHLYNAGLSEDEMQTYRLALTKLLNSLSWNRQIVQPRPLDPAKTILRVDLRDLEWTDEIWRKVIAADPYAIVHTLKNAQECQDATDCQVPSVRGDWFVSAASQPPLYYDVMQMSKDNPMEELERQLKVSVKTNLERHRAARAGFNGSGVSQNNRLIERHNSPYGALWVSYDFGGNTGRKNLFDHPLGPGDDGKHFEHDGGEIIFNLPNGLQGYLLVDAKNKRLDKGPTSIVSDERRPDRAVVNGLSCMSCHYAGIIVKDDSIRDQVLKNKSAYPESEEILALYPDRAEMSKLMNEDATRFQDACKLLGLDTFTKTGEPTVNMALRFESDLDRSLASAELGLTNDGFITKLDAATDLKRVFGVLLVDGGTIKREVFVKHFGDAAKKFGLGVIFNEKAGKKETDKPVEIVDKIVDKPKEPDDKNAPKDLPPGEQVAAPDQTPPNTTPPVGDQPGPPGYSTGNKTIRPGLVRNWSDRRGRFLLHGELVGFEDGKLVLIRSENGKISDIDIDVLSTPDTRVIFDHVSSEPAADLPESGTLPEGAPGRPSPVTVRTPPEFRTWTPTTGDREPFEARYVGIIGNEVILRMPSGERVNGPIDGLSAEDIQYIEGRLGRSIGKPGPEGNPGPIGPPPIKGGPTTRIPPRQGNEVVQNPGMRIGAGAMGTGNNGPPPKTNAKPVPGRPGAGPPNPPAGQRPPAKNTPPAPPADLPPGEPGPPR